MMRRKSGFGMVADLTIYVDDANVFIYDNVIFSENFPENTDIENWFRIVEGGEEIVDTKSVNGKNGILKVLKVGEKDDNADFINQIIERI